MNRTRRSSVTRRRFAEAMAALKRGIDAGECTPTADEARAIRHLCWLHQVPSPLPVPRPTKAVRA